MKIVQSKVLTGVPAPSPGQTWEKLRGDRFSVTFEASGTELVALHVMTYHVTGSPENSCRRVTNELRMVVLEALGKVGIDGRHAEILHQFPNISGSLNCETPTIPL